MLGMIPNSKLGSHHGKSRAIGVFIVCLPILVVLAGMTVVGTRGRTPTLPERIERYLAGGQFDHEYDQLLWNVAEPFIGDTRYDGRLTINGDYQPDSLNVYVLAHDPRHYFGDITCNCAAVGASTVICDHELLAFFHNLLTDSDPDRGKKAFEDALVQQPSKDQVFEINGKTYTLKDVPSLLDEVGAETVNDIYDLVTSRFAFALVEWLLGHEIGHVVLGHNLAAADSTSNSDQTLSDHQEIGADNFMIRRVASDETDAAYFWLTISSVVRTLFAAQAVTDHAIDRAVNLGTDPRSWPTITVYRERSDPHPPLLVRSADLFLRLVREGAVVDRTFDAVVARQHVKVAQASHGTEQTLCGTTLQPLLEVGLTVLNDGPTGADLASFDEDQAAQYTKLVRDDKAEIAWSEAIAILEKDRDISPTDLAEAYRGRGEARFRQQRFGDAFEDWRYAVTVDPDDAPAWVDGGFGLYELDRYDESVSWFQRGVSGEDNPEDYAGLAIADAAVGRIDAAIDAFQEAVAMNPRYASTTWLRFDRSWTDREACAATAILALIHGGSRSTDKPVICTADR
jgi:tetratricopeptide (TPR) repeat protein